MATRPVAEKKTVERSANEEASAKKKASAKKASAKKAPAKKKASAKKSASQKGAAKRSAGKKGARKFGPGASRKVATELRELKEGRLRSGNGGKVTSRRQAIAIGLAEARREGDKVPPPPK